MLLAYGVNERTLKQPVEPPRACPRCGAPLPAGALAGLCPACLLDQGMETATADAPVESGPQRFEPLPIEEVARLFPQLEVLSLLGAGGMGAVYKARQPALDRMVALKILPPHGHRGTRFGERFNREARALARLNHPNIVAVHEFGQAGGMHFFLMEFVDGANLRQLEKASRLSAREALQIIPQICDALQYAHDEGVVHRDIKPENVLVDRKGRVKIADFGLAKILDPEAKPDAARLTAEGQVMGTPHYMAPEQVERPLAVDHRADIYSLGVVFYEMLTGDLPLGKFPPPSRKVQLDVRLDEVVLKALENDPERRYQQASEVKQGVATVVENPPSARSDETTAPAVTAPSGSSARYLRWAGIPVVSERGGEREVYFQGALGAVFLTMMCATIGTYLIRGFAGVDHSLPRITYLAALFTALWGIRRTMNRPSDEPGALGAGATRPAESRHPYLRDYAMVVGLFLFVVGSHFVKPLLFRPKPVGKPGREVHQVARLEKPSGTMTARLPGGSVIELLAVADAGGAPNQWWRADGTLARDLDLELWNPVQNGAAGRVAKDLVFHVSGLPKDASGPYFSAEAGFGVASGGQVARQGKPLRDVVQVRVGVPADLQRTSIQACVGLQPWRTIATREAQGRSGMTTRSLGDPNWQSAFHPPTRTEQGEAQVSLLFGPEHRFWTHRLVAVDTNGTVHAANRAEGTPVEKMTFWTYTFDELPLSATQEFQLQVRPLHWVEFPDVALHPSAPLPEPQRLRLGAAVELNFDELVDFDTATTAAFPPAGSTTAPFAGIAENVLWAQEHGFDACAGNGELQVLDAGFVALASEEWDSLEPQQVIDRLQQAAFRPRVLKPTPDRPLPSVYAYRTREDGFGMVQLVGFDPERPGVTLRLRRVERPPHPVQASAGTPGTGTRSVTATPEKP